MSFVETSRWKISAATEARLLQLFNHKLIEKCNELQVECFDLGASVPHDSLHFYDDYHFTELGAARVANEVATFIHELPLLCHD